MRSVPTTVNERREGETDLHFFAHSFVVAAVEKSEHPAIQRITVGPFIVKSAESERRMKRIEPLETDARVMLMIEVPSEVFENAEKSGTGVLWVESDQIEVLDGKDRANQALQHNDPSCHAPCMRTCRASRGRGVWNISKKHSMSGKTPLPRDFVLTLLLVGVFGSLVSFVRLYRRGYMCWGTRSAYKKDIPKR